LRSLADKISGYGQGVHKRYPTGDVVVSVRDLAAQLGKRADAVAKALHLLLTEQKVQKAPLKGYWIWMMGRGISAEHESTRPLVI
jgi:DNA-binding transcriptional regulator YhcF (GntR family)